jgi:hypothetical protein
MKSNLLLKVWGIILTVAILSGLLMASVPVSAGSATWTQIPTPTSQFKTSSVDFLAAAADGKTLFAFTNSGTGATATATVGYAVASITLGGAMATAYTATPTVTIAAPTGGGTQATATATVAAGTITGFTITSGGSGYTAVPLVTITDATGTGQTGTAVLAATGAIKSVAVTAGGTGYVGATVAFTVGTLATATATFGPGGTITGYTVTAGGSGYTGATAVTVTGTGSKLYTSVNAGTSWTSVTPSGTANNLDGKTVTALAVSSGYATDQMVVATTSSDVWVSQNGGVTFNPITGYASLAGTGTINAVAVSPDITAGFKILVGTTTKMEIFSSSTFAWVDQSTITGFPALGGNGVIGVAFSPTYTADGEILAVLSTSATNTELHFRIMTSSVAAWDRISASVLAVTTFPTVTTTAVPPTKAVFGFGSDYNAYGAGQTLIGLSGGDNDDLFATTFATASSTAQTSAASITDLAVGGTLTPKTSIISVAVSGPLATGKIYIGKANGSVAKAAGIGSTVTFVPATKQPFGTNAIVKLLGTTVVAGTAGIGNGSAFYLSSDDAVTFNGISLISVTSAAGLKAQSFSAVDASTIFLLVKDGTNYIVLKTTDGGTTWTEVYYAASLLGVYASPAYATDSTVYLPVATGGSVLVSANGGSTFTSQFVAGSGAITAFYAVDGTTFYTGGGTFVAKSARFTSVASITGVTVYSIDKASNGDIFIGTTAGAVYRSTDDAVTFTQVGNTFGAANVSVHADPQYTTNKFVYASDSVTAGGFMFTVGTSVSWTALTIGASASANMDVGSANSAIYYGNGTNIARMLAPIGATAPKDTIDPASPVTAPTAWLQGASMDWVKVVVSSATSNTLMVIAGNTTAPTNAATYSPTYSYTFRLVTVVDGFLAAPVTTSPAASSQTLANPTITWTAIPGATAYDVQVANSYDTRFTAPVASVAAITTNAWAVVPTVGIALTAGNSYLYRVRVAAGSPLASNWAPSVAFTVKLTQFGTTLGISAPTAGAAFAIPAGATSTSPVFQWTPLAQATSYNFKLSSKPDFSDVIDSSVGITNNLYATPVKLAPGTYYWEVQGVAGTVVGDWVQSYFTVAAPAVVAPVTTAAPAPVVTPTFILPTQPAPIVTVNVPTPVNGSNSTSTPPWAWVVIAIGAVLVIAVIVLIVRTRRV